MNQSPTTRPGYAEVYDGERFDLRKHSEHVTPATEFFDQREIDRRTLEAIAAATISNGEYVENGIQEAEQYANQQSARVSRIDEVTRYREAFRESIVAETERQPGQEATRIKKPSLAKKITKLITGDDTSLKMPKIAFSKRLTKRELIQRESKVGRKLFGPIPKDAQREFFNLDERTWIWHEEYTDASGARCQTTTRYEVQEQGILKAQDGAQYSYIEGEELENFSVAVELYHEAVMRGVYHRDPVTGQKIAK